VIIVGRVHPGETNASWVVQGMMKYFTETSSSNLELKKLLRQCTVKIVPMINVDGVVAGNYRCSLIGKDMNRLYLQEDED
jgi:murein tripeptide amidase MpaA